MAEAADEAATAAALRARAVGVSFADGSSAALQHAAHPPTHKTSKTSPVSAAKARNGDQILSIVQLAKGSVVPP